MVNVTRRNTLIAMSGVVLSAVLSACTQANSSSDAGANQAQSRPLPSLSAAKFDEPVCFAHHDKQYDGVVSLHKDRSGRIIGKTFGVKKAANNTELQSFEQSLEGRYIDNYEINMDIVTYFENDRTRRTETVLLKGDRLTLGKFKLRHGDCKDVVNRFLDRDIKRRRSTEAAFRPVF